MKVLVIGSGAREHALVWALRRSPQVKEVFCAPGNPGIGELATLVPLRADDSQALLDFALVREIDLVVVGPEQPLANGLTDLLQSSGVPVFGPTQRAAELEWSKFFAKSFMARHGIPTAACRVFSAADREAAAVYVRDVTLPVVLKADGLAAGKGVVICHSKDEALGTMDDMLSGKSFGAAGSRVVVEEYLQGEEASIFALSDGTRYVLLAPAQDHKRIFDGDQGKNTGGMGAYAPAPIMTPSLLEEVEEAILRPTLAGMAAEGRPYRGCLYVGLMITEAGPRVIEYNVRFGDPETQVVLPLFEGDFASTLLAAATGKLDTIPGTTSGCIPGASAVCVVLASAGYPDACPSGREIHGLETLAAREGIIVFHAGTRAEGGKIVTAGGRVLGITAVRRSDTLRETIRDAYDAVAEVHFDGVQYRRDIGHRALARPAPPSLSQDH